MSSINRFGETTRAYAKHVEEASKCLAIVGAFVLIFTLAMTIVHGIHAEKIALRNCGNFAWKAGAATAGVCLIGLISNRVLHAKKKVPVDGVKFSL